MKKVLFVLFVSVVSLLSGCASTSGKSKADTIRQSGSNQETLNALAQLNEIKGELKQLRNSVEELQFESENGKRRQQDLFQDLDRRLIDIERNRQALNPEFSDLFNDSENSAEPTEGAAASGTADQVVVVDSRSASGSESTQSTNSSPGTTVASTSVTTTNSSGSVSLEQQNAYDQAFDLLKKSRYEDSTREFQRFVDTWPSSQLADDAYYWMSEARYVNRESEQALTGFRTVVSRYPDSPRVPEALLKIGYIQYDIGVYDEAAETFRDILARFPGHQVTVSAQTRLRRIEQTIQ